MARSYHRRPDRKSATISIPVSEDLRDRLWVVAAALGRTPTDIAREGLEKYVLALARGEERAA
jgi:predicted transcriptional regulator